MYRNINRKSNGQIADVYGKDKLTSLMQNRESEHSEKNVY